MNGIELRSGTNNCHWNIDGFCTNKEITRTRTAASFTRDWESKQNCVYTILGCHLCGEYVAQKQS